MQHLDLKSLALTLCAVVSILTGVHAQDAKALGQIPNPVSEPYYGVYPDVSGSIMPEAARTTIDGCYIPHDPATWTQASFVNGASGGDLLDDGSTLEIALPFGVDLHGTTYNSFWININGNVSFTGPYWQYSSSGFPNDDFVMMAPFWADVDLGGAGEIWYNLTPDAIYVNWVGTGYYNTQADKLNTFQLIITDGTNPMIGVGNNVAFYYDNMDWTTGSASLGSNGFGGIPATVGVNKGDGIDFFQIGRFDRPGTDYDGPGGNNDGVDYLDGQCITFSTVPFENINPIAQGTPPNNSITQCSDQSGSLDISFTGPELDQTVSVTITSDLPGFSIDENTNGNLASTEVSWTSGTSGNYQIQYTAMDNFTTPGVTQLTIDVVLEQCCQPSLEITCPADAVVTSCEESTLPDATGMATATYPDCVDEPTILYTDELINDECGQVLERTWTATSGDLSATCTQMITVQDMVPPVFQTTPESGIVECLEDVPPAEPQLVTDNCSGVANLQFNEESTNQACPTITRTWVATDGCGNQSSIQQVIQVIDTEAPVFTVEPENVTIDCSEQIPPAIWEVSDNCDENVTVNVAVQTLGGNQNCQLRTQTPGGWGAPANGNNPGVYRDANFDSAFPSGLTIGCDNTMILESASEVQAFLPSGGTPSALPAVGNVDPNTVTNTFAGHLVAIKLSVGFDNNDPLFGQSDLALENAVLSGGTFEGYSVSEIIAIADQVIGGCSDEFTPSQLTDALSAINENFVDGTQNNGAIVCSQECTEVMIRTITATDNCQNQSIVQQVITIEDTTGPQASMDPENVTIQCGEDLPPVTDVTWTDNCSEPTNIQYNEEESGSCPTVITRVWSAEDECGNQSFVMQQITIVDQEGPIFNMEPQDVEIECGQQLPEPPMIDATDCSGVESIVLSVQISSVGCPVYTRTWTATDNCGNTSSVDQVISVVDDEDPVFDPYEVYIQVACQDLENVPELTATDNCSDVEVSYTQFNMSGGCSGTIYRIYTATDDCGNTTTVDQIIGLYDNEGPEILGTGGSYTVDCNSIPEIPQVTYQDNCSDLDEIETDFSEEIVTGDCPANYDIVWTWTAIDYCDNVTVVSETISVRDEEGPVPSMEPQDVVIDCSMEVPEAPEVTWTDACSTYTSDFTETRTDGNCDGNYMIEREWSAIDACGNETIVTQTIISQDTTAPEFTEVPADVTISCDATIASEMALAEDDCSGVEVMSADEIIPTDCPTEYTIQRTFTAIDGCGNQAQAIQLITIEDNDAPMLSLMPSNMIIDCEATVPEAPEVTATDNCDASVEVVYEEELVGDLPDPDATRDCLLTQPVDQQTPEDWAMFLFQGSSNTYYNVVEASYVEYEEAGIYTAYIEATLVNSSNPNAGFNAYVELTNGLTWGNWINQGFTATYKDDFNLAGDNYLDWLYFIISNNSTLTGWGDYEGSTLNLMHAPSSFLYGFQVGVAASNVNSALGAGGWFTYQGIWVDASTDFNQHVSGSGDFAFDLDCCPRYDVVRTWTAEDCAGNITSHQQIISFEELDALAFQPGNGNVAVSVDRPAFELVNLYPIPADDAAKIIVQANEDVHLTAFVVDLSGIKLMRVDLGPLAKKEQLHTELDVTNLNPGFYVVYISSGEDMDVRPMVIQR